ncbi:pyrroline-5-carboxylate reductase [Lederbergia wuyishanensis]|uniref:Pyrroline-5-carboxylate reductase n=1 Tax=Lederbergia wuyishanensis TaxID=1347903 RepID=A0ABU0D152_9BACI|nr:pyrroline-5-carboxylate reductase [Lederbergia wuyishanensis]MCJ8006755.1 pyrroline-5-carboxylate reductase [Lederbergia wuyishanensis]MDQ0342137.1 pyrroline-5-carboxylate reductase [Lederbergia wuyishanensis]
MKISFVGAGSIAEAMIAGLIEKNIVNPKNICITNRNNKQKMTELEQKYGIYTTYDTNELVHDADMIIFAVKPKDAGEALDKISPYIRENSFFVSVMAGISIEFITDKLKTNCAIARTMPNTSASVGKSATAITFNPFVSNEQKELALSIFSSIGITEEVAEHQMDAITALSGSGPAYFYYVVEAMERAAAQFGLEKDTANQLIIQTLLGAAEMLSVSGKKASELRHEVTSPGGTTEAGISVLHQAEMQEAFIACINAAYEQSKQLGIMYESKIT